MGEIKKGNHIMKLFNCLRGLFRRKEWTPHGKVWVNPDDAPEWADGDFERATVTHGPLSHDYKVVRDECVTADKIHAGAITARSFAELRLMDEIARLRRNKKKHSHLQKELDALIDRGADTQTNNGDDQ